MQPRILIATTSHAEKGATGEPTGAYVAEIAHPYAVFSRAGYQIEFASVKGGRVPLDGVDEADEQTRAFLASDAVKQLHTSRASDALDVNRYDAVYFAGGHGAMWDLPNDPGFRAFTAHLYERGGVVAAVCHGPAALVEVTLRDGHSLLAGQPVSGFTNEEERAVKLDGVVPFSLQDKLIQKGGLYRSAPLWQAHVAVGDRLVTGQNPASAAKVAEAVVQLLQQR